MASESPGAHHAQNKAPRLSKTRFLHGWQCRLRLWNTLHRPDLATPPDDAQQAVFDVGHRVGELAQARYPCGVLVDARAPRRAGCGWR